MYLNTALHYKMNVADYVARRMLDDVCEIPTAINSNYEFFYGELFDWMQLYTEQFGGRVLHRLPRCKNSREELLHDMAELYSGVLSRVEDINSMITLHSLFTLSFYMMVRYKEHPDMCGNISYYFGLITRRLESWNLLNYITDNYDM